MGSGGFRYILNSRLKIGLAQGLDFESRPFDRDLKSQSISRRHSPGLEIRGAMAGRVERSLSRQVGLTLRLTGSDGGRLANILSSRSACSSGRVSKSSRMSRLIVVYREVASRLARRLACGAMIGRVDSLRKIAVCFFDFTGCPIGLVGNGTRGHLADAQKDSLSPGGSGWQEGPWSAFEGCLPACAASEGCSGSGFGSLVNWMPLDLSRSGRHKSAGRVNGGEESAMLDCLHAGDCRSRFGRVGVLGEAGSEPLQFDGAQGHVREDGGSRDALPVDCEAMPGLAGVKDRLLGVSDLG